ncbi:MAG: bifunctional pyr operon transcriptional regulator/uracil phosphoribosyltransferase PyrR [Verrucomicrobiota bacterium]|jgi:pyrimidine operon attenuation protein/uracil phosphoribosyltransferase
MSTSLTAENIATAIESLATQIRARHPQEELTIIGIRSRGDEVAERLCTLLATDDRELNFGTLDISLYRDDFEHLRENPKLQGSDIDCPIDDATVILVDDVLFTGRTIRAALDALSDYGRPGKVELAVLIDRGHREMPIQPDFVGISLATERSDHVWVCLEGTDGEDKVLVSPRS